MPYGKERITVKIILAFIRKNPVLAYYFLVFAISWGGMLIVGGSNIFAGTSWQTDPLFMSAVQAMLAGPPVAGIVMTVLVSGKKGLRQLLSRLFKISIGARWYAIALVTAPIVQASVLFSLSLASPEFLPAIIWKDGTVALLASGIAVGLLGGLVEELGWTGFAIPFLRLRHSVLATGLVVGILWGVWHLLQMLWVGGTSAEGIPPLVFMLQYIILAVVQLTAFRILMVWVYSRTESLLLAVLMHASYIFSTLFVLAPPTTGASFLTYSWTFTGILCVIVAGVGAANRGQLWKLAAKGSAI